MASTMAARRVLKTTVLSALVVLAAALLAACTIGTTKPALPASGKSAANAGPIGVSLKEWRIDLTAPSTKAGTVKFAVRNDGNVPHDLVIVKSEFAANRLPTASGLVDESKVTIVARTAPLTPGDGKELAIELPKGAYALICNVIGHYNSGQFAAFTAD